MSDNASVIRLTGQSWNLVLGSVALVAGSILPVWPQTGLDWISGSVLAIAGYAFACYAIRCPACGDRWFWSALMRPEVYGEVFRRPACPTCREDFAPRP